MMNCSCAEGNWEERGVIGTRIEISGNSITILWRNSPVLETNFSVYEESDGTVILRLERTGLRYQYSREDYAEVRSIKLKGEKLIFSEYFPITGESVKELTRTDSSRYGNVVITDEILPQLRGTWKDDRKFIEIRFDGREMVIENQKYIVHAVQGPSERGTAMYRIINDDPSKYGEFGGFYDIRYCCGILTACIMVCDAPRMEFVLRKNEV